MSTKRSPHNSRLGLSLGFLVAMLVAVMVMGSLSSETAQGHVIVDDKTLGISDIRSTLSDDPDDFITSTAASALLEADASADGATFDLAGSTVGLSLGAQRFITVKNPDPVVTFAAIDTENPLAISKAQEVGNLDPLPSAPRTVPDVTGPGWMSGSASAYDLEDNDGWDATASGVTLHHNSVTVAVPLSQRHLMGSVVEIVYGDKVVVATVTDVGGFEKYGRALDLAGGVWRAFGYSHVNDWGVQQVYYRFL